MDLTIEGERCAGGIIASARGTGLRVSFHAYNNDEDVDAVLEALDREEALVCRGSQQCAREARGW